MKIAVVGGGFAGASAAFTAAKAGASVTLFERTDLLLGTGLVGGIMYNNGRMDAAEQMKTLGFGAFFDVLFDCALHRGVDFPKHEHAILLDVTRIANVVLRALRQVGVDVHLTERVFGVEGDSGKLDFLLTPKARYDADAFIDATGSSAVIRNCSHYGNGCAMCIQRCHMFGARISMSESTRTAKGAMSGSCKLLKESLSEEIQQVLNKNGVAIIPVPRELQTDKTGIKACRQYADNAYTENIVLLDTGCAKMMTPFMPYETLQQIPGFENARYIDPICGGQGNSIRLTDYAETDENMRVVGYDNLLACGERAGLLVGHTEAIVTGTLAGINAVNIASGQPIYSYPQETVMHELISANLNNNSTRTYEKLTFSTPPIEQ